MQSSLVARLLAEKTTPLSNGSILQEAFKRTFLQGGLYKKITRRNVFFSFHYDDIMRVNNVRQSGLFVDETFEPGRLFYDRSLWESSKRTDPDSLKSLIREGVKNTSVVCVLVGSDTAFRPWVRYEIARAIIDLRGLLAVHINGIPHHTKKLPHARGYNPLQFMGVGKIQENRLVSPRYFLFERFMDQWLPYADYTRPVSLPPYLPDPQPGFVTPLSSGAAEYDYAQALGAWRLASWLDQAAQAAGR